MPLSVTSALTAVDRASQMDRSLLARLRPVILGPKAALHRYSVSSEKASLGTYDKLADHTFTFPNRVSTSVIDQNTVKVFADNAWLNFFNKYTGANGSCQCSSTYPNRVRAANYVFKTGNSVSRSADFGDRDVKVGDLVQIQSGATILNTVVTGFVGETIAAVTGTATADSNNKATQTLSASISQVSSTPINEVVAIATGTAYESTADGYATRTYTITVTQASTGSDATTARLSVVSSDGLDNVASVTPAAFASPTAIGTKGLTVTFSLDVGHAGASGSGIDQDDFVVGQQWVVTVSQAFTAPTATAAGTYTGTRDDTYVVTVTRGGAYTGTVPPQITVSTTNGSDRSGPTSITAASTPFAVGSYGVTISLNQTKLRKGDVYYIPVTAAAQGGLQTLVLRDDVPVGIRGIEVNLRLFANRVGFEVAKHTTTWSTTSTGITVKGGITVTDSEFTTGGVLTPVVLETGTLYVDYREWLTDSQGSIVQVSKRSDIVGLLGPVDRGNPLAQGVDFALQNTAGELDNDVSRPAATTTDIVYAVSIGGDPAVLANWTNALRGLEDNEFVYDIVPLSFDASVQSAVVSHVLAQSADSVGFYRRCFLAGSLTETLGVVTASTTSDASAATATTSGVTVTASSNAQFLTNGVRSGDVLRISYATDADGVVTYSTFVVDTVLSQTTLTVTTTIGTLTPARQIEVWRTLTPAELVTQQTALATSRASGKGRVFYVLPDRASFGGTDYDGYYVAAAVAGLAGSVASHQNLRNVALVGFDSATRVSKLFTSGQQKDLQAGGVFLVSQITDGTVYLRSTVSTDLSPIGLREEMMVRNADMIRMAIQDAWSPYVGSGNATGNIRPALEAALAQLESKLRGVNIAQLGTPVGALRLVDVSTVVGSPDQLSVTVSVGSPAVPLNLIQLVLDAA